MMDQRSELLLAFVHEDLARIIRNASQKPQPFVVVYGVRTVKDEAKAVASGHSQTTHSRHLAHENDGLSRAVDVAAVIDGKVSFAPGNEKEIFSQIAEQILESADELKIPLQWGGAPIGAWYPGVKSNFRDWGHFQLPWLQYS